MLLDLQLSGTKPSTQKTYLREAENLAKYFHKSPEQLGEDELKEYLLYLMKERHLSEGTFRFYVAGLKFLYRTTLKREWVVEKIRYPRAKRKLPVVLDLSEVQSLFSVTKNFKHKAILIITYSSGLRVSETARFKLTDIDSKRMMVRIRQGKGGKDRNISTSNSPKLIDRSLPATSNPLFLSGLREAFFASRGKLIRVFLEASQNPSTSRLNILTEFINVALTRLHFVCFLLSLSNMVLTNRRQFVFVLFQASREPPSAWLNILTKLCNIVSARASVFSRCIRSNP
jgi:site-specific recombinase XerD